MRDKHNANLHKREELRKTGQLGKLIELLTCEPPNELDLQTLPCPTAGQVTDHYANQRTLNNYFQGWYEIPKDLDPAAMRLATDPVWHTALYVYAPEVHDGVPLHPESNIPADMQEGGCAKSARKRPLMKPPRSSKKPLMPTSPTSTSTKPLLSSRQEVPQAHLELQPT